MDGKNNLLNAIRVGMGYDSHRIETGGSMILGGLVIEQGRHFVGHSDADVLLHAITDAVLSGAGLPDIGQIFPNDRPENRGRDSAEMLRLAMANVRQAGWDLVNLDCVVLLESPKLSPIKSELVRRIADILEVGPTLVGLKGKTGEGVGEVGRGELAVVHAVALLHRT
jgi:2-C-methyl-D-erythritol 2,4-cyclodiphosphate synthase